MTYADLAVLILFAVLAWVVLAFAMAGLTNALVWGIDRAWTWGADVVRVVRCRGGSRSARRRARIVSIERRRNL